MFSELEIIIFFMFVKVP